MTLRALIDAFLHDRERSGCRPATLRAYRGRIRPLAAAHGDRDVASLTRGELLEFIDAESHWPADDPDIDRRGTQKAPDTIRLLLTVLSMLQEFAVDREHITAAWLKPKDLKKPRGRQRERLPTDDEVAQIIAAAPADWLPLYEALRRTGARPAELVGATIEQIETVGSVRTLVIEHHKTSRKTGKPRKIPISRSVAPFFAQAMGDRRKGPIFRRVSKRPWTVAAASGVFRRIRRELGLPEEIVLYCTRHECGSRAAKKAGIYVAKELLGHENITTTQRYAHMTDEERQQAQEGLYDDTVAACDTPSQQRSEAAA